MTIIELNVVHQESMLAKNAETLTKHIESKSNKAQEYFYGAYIPLDDCWEDMIKILNKAIDSVEGVTLNQALEGTCIIMCPDGAVHNF